MIFPPLMPRVMPSPTPPPLPPSRPYHHTTHNTQNVEIHQQPHDAADAARLYGELKTKAEQEILKATCVQLDGFKAEFLMMELERSLYNMSERYRVAFKVNGQAMQSSIEIEDIEKAKDKSPHIAALRKIAEGITDTIMQRLLLQYYASQRRFG